MTATAAMVRTDRPRTRTIELILAHAHLRLGALALARVELETMATLGTLDDQGLVDLAEVRWRTGDLTGAGEVAAASLRGEVDDPVALVIAAEAAASDGRPGEARRYAQRAMAMAGGTIDAIFAGMPRSVVWPPDADEPPPTAPTLFDRGPDIAPLEATEPAPSDPIPAAAVAAAAAAAKPSTGPMTLGFWDDDEAGDPGPADLPDPGAALEAGRMGLVTGSPEIAALHFSLALRLAPALAPAILEAIGGARGPAIAIVRGDAYRAAGHELEARNAYAEAARGGPPERRKRSRVKEASPIAASLDDETDEADELDGPGVADGTPVVADGVPEAVVDPSADHPDDTVVEPGPDLADEAVDDGEATTEGDPIA